MSTKVCIACEVEKPYAEYQRLTTTSRFSDGYVNTCRQCKRVSQNKWRVANREKMKRRDVEHKARRTITTVMDGVKTCGECGYEKPVDQFPKNYRMANGRLNRCKTCEYERIRQWRIRNPERVKAANIKTQSRVVALHPNATQICKKCRVDKPVPEFHVGRGTKLGVRRTCKECILAAIASESDEKRELRRKRSAQWLKDNPETAMVIRKRSYRKHREKKLQGRKEWRARNLERDRQREKNYLKNNRPIVYAKNARRRAAETQAVPKWLTAIQKAQIQEFYEIALAREMQTGEKHHVDHIVPLRGEGINGLHVPWNLQVLTEFENCSKHNKLSEVIS